MTFKKRVGLAVCFMLMPLSSPAEVKFSSSGLIEVEYATSEGFDGSNTGELRLDTLLLAMDARISSGVSAHLQFLYEQDETTLEEVDEGTVTLGAAGNNGFYMTAGIMYVPFGVFESRLVSEPLTYEIGETRETAFQWGIKTAYFSSSLFAFNGDVNEAGAISNNKDTVNQFGGDLNIHTKAGELGVHAGISYINSLGDTDGVSEQIPDQSVDAFVPAISYFLSMEADNYTFITEKLKATDSFTAAELPWRQQGAKPGAENIEISYSAHIGESQMTFSFGTQKSNQAVSLQLPKKRKLFGITMGVGENATLGFEWAKDNDYTEADGGTGRGADTFTVELATTF